MRKAPPNTVTRAPCSVAAGVAAAVEGVGSLLGGAGSRIMMSSSSSHEMYVGPGVDVRRAAGVGFGTVAGACWKGYMVGLH